MFDWYHVYSQIKSALTESESIRTITQTISRNMLTSEVISTHPCPHRHTHSYRLEWTHHSLRLFSHDGVSQKISRITSFFWTKVVFKGLLHSAGLFITISAESYKMPINNSWVRRARWCFGAQTPKEIFW